MANRLEKSVENWVVKIFEKHGGECWKFTSPGRRGVPDRIGMLPGARIWFIETKRQGENPSPLQRVVHRILGLLGFKVWVLDTIEKVLEFEKTEISGNL